MWTRAELKTKAKMDLKRNLGAAVLVCFIAGIIVQLFGMVTTNLKIIDNPLHIELSLQPFVFSSWVQLQQILILFKTSMPDTIAHIVERKWILTPIIGATLFTANLAISIFILSPLEVGKSKWFRTNSKEENKPPISKLFSSFTDGHYFSIVVTLLIRDIFNFLWFMLLFIPGIVKSYSYRMVPWILADNPEIGYRRAIDLSQKMTNGHKVDMFVLDLSFFGWGCLAVLTLGLGDLLLAPYVNATHAELYEVLRENALNNGCCTHDELELKEQN